jgi:hypothetical protein
MAIRLSNAQHCFAPADRVSTPECQATANCNTFRQANKVSILAFVGKALRHA